MYHGDMWLFYRDRTTRWVIEVTYASGAVRSYGPIFERELAESFLRSRLVPNTYTGMRGRAIQSAKVVKQRRRPDKPRDGLLGVRLVLP